MPKKLVSFMFESFEVRTLMPEDVSVTYLKWFDDEKTKQFIKYALKKPSLAELQNYVHEKLLLSDCEMWGLFDSTGKHLGNIKFEPIDRNKEAAVLGILLGPEARGAGLGKKLIQNSLDHLLNNFGIRNIELGVETKNLPAIMLYESLGFKKIGKGILLSEGNEISCMQYCF